jgi:cholesterol transport system auxiliary component
LARLLLAPALFSGCALTSKGEALRPRYFDPAVARAETAQNEVSGNGIELRLGAIDSSSYLREPIAFRVSETELGYDETRRWTEKPEEYLRRELSRALFEEHAFTRALGGDGPTLEAELLEFAELRQQHKARVRISVLLHDDHTSLLEQTITVEQPIAATQGADDAPAMVRAISAALEQGVEQIATRVAHVLRAAPEKEAARSERDAERKLSNEQDD